MIVFFYSFPRRGSIPNGTVNLEQSTCTQCGDIFTKEQYDWGEYCHACSTDRPAEERPRIDDTLGDVSMGESDQGSN